jgi:hypothetical protein
MSDEDTVEYSYEYWDCPCGIKAIRGDITICSGCGRPRDADVSFYRKEGQPELVSDEAKLERFKAGPDWVCSFCQELNSALKEDCPDCGHKRFESDKNYFANQNARRQRSMPEGKTAKPWDRRKIVGSILVLVSLLLSFFWWAAQTQPVDYQVSMALWERSIPVERYSWINREDWQGDVHGEGLEKILSQRQIRRYESRQVGTHTEHYTESERYQSGTRDEVSTSYESLGNGAGKTVTHHTTVPVYSERTVHKTRQVADYKDFPIYDTKVKYRAKEYQPLNTARAEGKDNNPAWPDFQLKTGLEGKPDREGTRKESYKIVLSKCSLKDKGPAQWELKPPVKDFTQKYLLGKHIKYLVTNIDTIDRELADESK